MNNSDDLRARLMMNTPLLDAIAREGNFTRAADQVGIEQSAVSHRVKTLEEALDIRLFERTTRKIVPTEAGKIVCEAAQRCRDIWSSALERIGDVKTSKTLRLSVSSSVAMKWVVPCLQRAQEAGLDLVVDVEDRLVDLHSGEAQVAIRYGVGSYPGFHAEPLIRSQLIPVARPNGEEGWLSSGAVANRMNLLVDKYGERDGTGFSWEEYFEGRGWQETPRKSTQSFARADLAIQAAISGMGVALGRTLLVENDVEARFLEIVGKPVECRAKYWLVTTSAYAATDGYKLLRDWLHGEVEIVRKQQAFLMRNI